MTQNGQDNNADNRREVGLRLVSVRKQAELSQVEMANKLEVTLRSYQTYEQGTREIPRSLYVQLRKLFHTDPGWLMEGPAAGPSERKNVINEEAWMEAFWAVHHVVNQAGAKITEEQKMLIIQSVYRELMSNGVINETLIIDFVKVASK